MISDVKAYTNILNEFNKELGPLLNRGSGKATLDVLRLIRKYSDKIVLLWNPETWQSVKGKSLKGVPFELEMLGMALLTSCWTSQIFNLKARDRKNVGMLKTYLDFKGMLYWLLNRMEFDVWRKTDPVAEGMYIAELVRFNQQDALKRIGVIPLWRQKFRKILKRR